GFQIGDLYLQFLSWRYFGFRELARRNLALWNPYIFGGAPYFGALQAALLYPPNWLFLILPLAVAVNWSIALHVFAIGAFTFCWMRVRGLHVAASFLASVLIMFGGAHFMHIFAGHLPHLLAMTWAPLIFCAIDGLSKHRTIAWCLLGIFAVAMQILAGFPQHVFYEALGAGLYSALRLTQNWSWRLAAGLVAIYLGGAAISAVQLLPTGQTMRETIRGLPLPFEFASQLAFPPENFITLLAPCCFGGSAFLLAAMLGAGLYWTLTTNEWRPFMDKIHYAEKSFFSEQLYASPELAAHSQHQAAISLIIAATTCALFAALLAVSRWKPRARYGIIILAVMEMGWFALLNRPTFNSTSAINPDEKAFLEAHSGDYRILNLFNPNSAMSIRVPDIWGYDASVVRRYTEFVTWSQGAEPDKATQDVDFNWFDPLFAMLRLRFVIVSEPGNFQAIEFETPPMPHVLLISKYRVAENRDAVFDALRSPDFEPRLEAILEGEPSPAPVATETPWRAQITAESTDSLTIEADTDQPALLLITDVFTPSWRAVSLPGSSQSN